jgi:hypothetical protein
MIFGRVTIVVGVAVIASILVQCTFRLSSGAWHL